MGNDEGQGTSVRIDLGERSYDILIGRGLLDERASFDGLPPAPSAAIVTNTTVSPLYAGRLKAALGTRYARVLLIELPDGEAHKDWTSLNAIFDALLGAGCDRKTLLFALGGGVVGDIAGFAAACYMRGVPFVQVPTTLLAQVDSSVGGKTAINHPLGKNMIGAFHQPLRVVADLATLATLPQREIVAGLAEVIKYGPIADETLLGWLEANLDALIARDAAALAWAVRRSCEIKAWVVGQDEREGGLRAIPELRPHLRPRDRVRPRLRAVAARRGVGLRHGDGSRALGAPGSDRRGLRAAPDAPDRARGFAHRGPGARRQALPGADAGRQEGRGR